MSARVLPPINVLFLCMERKLPVSIWLAEQTDARLEGVIAGFDEFMNVVLDDAFEVNVKTMEKREIGQMLLKGDCITLVSTRS